MVGGFDPVAAARKKDKARDAKRNRDLRRQTREQSLQSMTVSQITAEIAKLERVERSGQATPQQAHWRQRLVAAVEPAKVREAAEAKSRSHTNITVQGITTLQSSPASAPAASASIATDPVRPWQDEPPGLRRPTFAAQRSGAAPSLRSEPPQKPQAHIHPSRAAPNTDRRPPPQQSAPAKPRYQSRRSDASDPLNPNPQQPPKRHKPHYER